MIEPNRPFYSGIDDIRKEAYKNIDKAVYIALKQTIDFNTEKNRTIHPLSILALNYYENHFKEELL